ncbi:MAG TPA: hypothetical protein PKL77_07690 [Candidatus Omnitrophota bacterium]|nr:hypothetical protein [Candidatus Omnitrophota bacterium]
MKPSDNLRRVHDIEAKFPVETWEINGIHIWPLIRFELKKYFFNRDHPDNLQGKTRKTSYYTQSCLNYLSGSLKHAYVSLLDSSHTASIKEQAQVVFLTYSVHKGLVKNKWFDRYCDPFVECFRDQGISTLMLESELSAYIYRIPRFSDSIYIQQQIDLIRARNLFSKKRPVDEKVCYFDTFLNYVLSSDMNDFSISLNTLRHQIGILLDFAAYFKKILAAIKPKIAFIADYYSSLESLGFVIACRQSNIQCADIQHGTVGAFHLAYSGWTKIPETGYELLPHIFWCWSKKDADEISKWSREYPNGPVAFIGGNLWLNLWLDPKNQFVAYYDTLILNTKNNHANLKYILYTADTYFGLPEWLTDVMRSTSDSLFWWVRMHPSQLEQKGVIKKLLQDRKVANFDIDLASDLPMPALLRHTDVHVTATSSSIKEAALFSVPSVFTHPDAFEHHQQEVSSGMALNACTFEALITAIQTQLTKKHDLHAQNRSFEDNQAILKRFWDTLDLKPKVV